MQVKEAEVRNHEKWRWLVSNNSLNILRSPNKDETSIVLWVSIAPGFNKEAIWSGKHLHNL